MTTSRSDEGVVDPRVASSAADFGALLSCLRKAAGLSLRDLENETSVPGRFFLARSTVQKVEKGRSIPAPQWLASYLTACGVSVREQRNWQTVRRRLADLRAARSRRS